MEPRSSGADVSRLNMPEELKEIDIRVSAPGTIRVSCASPHVEEDKGVSIGRPSVYKYPLDEEISPTTWRYHKVNLLALVDKALSEAGDTPSGRQLADMREKLKRATDARSLEGLRAHWKPKAEELLPPSYKLSPRRQAGTVTWLHLSDLHCMGKADYERDGAVGFNRAIVVEKLWTDIEKMRHDTGHDLKDLDFVCLTGDLAYHGRGKEYQFLREEVLPKLMASTDLDETRLFVVPGNHDVDRGKVSNSARDARETLLGRSRGKNTPITEILADPNERKFYFERLEAYRAFFQCTFGSRVALDEAGYFYSHCFSLSSGVIVAVLGLNSAWLSEGGKIDRHRLVLGEYQVKTAIDRAKEDHADLLIALLHHPLYDWLMPNDDRRKVILHLNTGCHFVLQGHIHENEAHQQDELHFIRAGAVYDERHSPSHNSYNFVKLNLDNGEGRIYFRRYSDQKLEWVADNNVPDTTDAGIKPFTLNR